MIVLDLEQGSDEWVKARLGVVAASEASRLVTATGRASSGDARNRYMRELLVETWQGEPVGEFGGNYFTDRGRAMEPEAFSWYAFSRGEKPQKVGLVYRDESRRTACSPDALVGEDGGLELKCPMPETHMLYLLECGEGGMPAAYRVQVQFSLWVTGRAWWDFMSYCPRLPEAIVRVCPESEYQDRFDEVVPKFLADMRVARARLIGLGVEFPADNNEATR